MSDLQLELCETNALIKELSKRFPHMIMMADRQATTDDERTYVAAMSGDPWRCTYLAHRAAHILQNAIDKIELDETHL